LPATPINTVLRAKDIAAKAGCKYVYVGNTPEIGFENTFCPGCKKLLVERRGFAILSQHLDAGKCHFCGYPIHGVWE
jgi:pyruvate formate lyase activating enzyme